MSEPFDPVEKVVETLFFHLVFQANPTRPFIYAALSGKAEKRFGDALAYVGTVFVFEFKRSVVGVADELKKFKRVPSQNEARFGQNLNRWAEQLDKVRGSEAANWPKLLSDPPNGHYLVALKTGLLSEDQNSCRIQCASDPANLDIRPYLSRLRNSLCESVDANQGYRVVGLVERSGMTLEDARAYFQLISALKTADGGKGESGETETLFACFAVDSRGSVGIASCAGLQELHSLFKELQQRNQNIERELTTNADSDSQSLKEDQDGDAPGR